VCTFLLGAAVAGRTCRHVASRRLWLVLALFAESGLAGAATVDSALVSGHVGTGWARDTVIALLAFARGLRNSTNRRLAVPDQATTVLTMTLTGLAADSSLAGGHNPGVARRSPAVLAMLAGAIVGAALFFDQGATLPLAIVPVAVVAAAAPFAVSRASRQLDPG
jgi:uncharacterized membrane protein YoaK (UPF0700 family)